MSIDKNKPIPDSRDGQSSLNNATGDRCGHCDNSCGGCGGCTGSGPRGKLHCYNWLGDIPGGFADNEMVEVQFKNTRKGYYKNSTNIPLSIGDWVAVEASPGHDIGQVTLTGALVKLQMTKARVKPDAEIKRIFRKAKPSDMEKFEEAKARENDTMIRSRKIAESLNLNMKIGDVEYQGDGNKAIFYYIADERVDFRQLIKVLAETFKVRIEMKQIGARQEAGRIGGIGPCGRPLCCTTWLTNFVSVSTGAARYQDISLNPQKLAGQCAKLKCCLNFEVDSYVEAGKKIPGKDIKLETADSTYYYFKADIFKGEITYSTDKHIPANLVTITAERAWEVVNLNKKGEKPQSLKEEVHEEKKPSAYADILGQDSLTRFDNKKKKKRKGAKGGNNQAKDGKEGKEGKESKEGNGNNNGAGATDNAQAANSGKPNRPSQQQQQQQQPRQRDNQQNRRNNNRGGAGKQRGGEQRGGERKQQQSPKPQQQPQQGQQQPQQGANNNPQK